MLPLQYAVQTKPATFRFVPDYLKCEYRKTLVGLLLEQYPKSAMVADGKGRLPLHYALEKSYLDENDLLTLVKLYPESLHFQDPVSRLYPCMLVAAQSNQRLQMITTPSPLSNWVDPLWTTDVALTQINSMTDNDSLGESEPKWETENFG